MRLLLILLILVIIEGCRPSVREEIEKKSPSWVSPDEKALIYQSNYEENGTINISLTTWVETGLMKGGAGIFNMKNNKLDTLKVMWTSDTSATIEYPNTATVSRQESKTYFAGRTIHLTYKATTY